MCGEIVGSHFFFLLGKILFTFPQHREARGQGELKNGSCRLSFDKNLLSTG